jgi:glycosidase
MHTSLLGSHPNDIELQRIIRGEIQLKSRDNARTPMQWDNNEHAGFSTTTPWQAENPSYKIINAATQVGIEGSVFEYWASILRLRKCHKDILIYGDFKLVDEGNNDVFAYSRSFGKDEILVVTNFRKESIDWEITRSSELEVGKLLISNYDDISVIDGKVQLRSFEAFAVLVT